MTLVEFLPDAAATERLGERLAAALEPRDVVVLTGVLGAGKTTLVRGLARGLGSPSHVRSASFTWVQEYRGRLPIVHLDLYRLRDPAELAGIGWEEYLERPGVVVVEWGERAAEALPRERWEVRLALEGEGRRAEVAAVGEGPCRRAAARLGARA
ncbi:MAG TPA: tRNA (adenosine(37)-N6)-threonylcarbamoyltransferase complex ATPase subunit type 1 TsaE [Candidatus Saccharimonadales bacterium]|nr:tRNA (adenosine(37)-N6)-threonylcarbamoyltransferase complex ATPase subunit type 1 TsaE [Candidatus Saccharimonadales bacterium]